MRKIIIAVTSVVLALSLASMVQASNPHGNPPGNDGDLCHGANQQTCRPDPQPSHGAECDPHGNNPDGNDDHCGPTEGESPSLQPTVTPTPSIPHPSVSVKPSPTPESSLIPPVTTTKPSPTPTASQTATPKDTRTPSPLPNTAFGVR